MVSFLNGRLNAKAGRKRAVRPTLEGLEDRMLLYAVTGDHFTYGSRVTWSVMPDGTSLGSFNSNLISTLDRELGPESNWLPAIEDAFAQWESSANVNFAQVPDGGQPFNYGNIQQDSPNFGDVRIGGFNEGSGILAFTMLPPASNGGSDSGDILINTSMSWNIGNNYDLETVLVHEIGHALGLGHSASPTAVMYAYYQGVNQDLSTDDIAGVDSIWGARQEDGIASSFNNHTFATAFNLYGFVNPNNYQAVVPYLDVVNSAESYWFKVTTPSNASNVFTAQVQSTGLSELCPEVQIWNASDQGLVGTTAPASAYGATINATITNATPNTTYYIRVLAGTANANGAGGYTLTVNMGYGYIAAATAPNTLVYTQADQGGGDLQDGVGGANTVANTPVDLADLLNLGSTTVPGDALTVPKIKHFKIEHAEVKIKVAHPTHPKAEETHSKAREKAKQTVKH